MGENVTEKDIEKFENCVERTLEDVNEVLELAKLTEDDILPGSQAIFFTEDDMHNTSFRLLELDKHLLESLSEGQTLRFMGEDDEEVVLCTETKTYDVVETETSNSLLLVNNLKFTEDLKEIKERGITKVTVTGIFHDYLEPLPSKPHLKKLQNILDKSLYKGRENEYTVDEADLWTQEQLLSTIQASKKELEEALKSMNVILLDGKVRVLETDYHFRVLTYMLKLIEENSWTLDEIQYETTLESLRDLVPVEILNCLFDLYCEESKIIDGDQLYKYNEAKVCQFFAKVLLQTASRFSYEEFLQAWSQSVPEGMTTAEEMLYGVALIDTKSNPKSIKYYPEEDLPETIENRLKVLFEAKEKWSIPEISPYIQRLATEKLNVNALLAKYARASTEKGVKYYSAKHAK